MEYTELYRQLFEVIQKIAGEEIVVKKEMNIIEELHFDSIQIVELAVNVEELFNIEFSSFEGLIDSFESVDKTINYFVRIIVEKEKHDSELTLWRAYDRIFPIGTTVNRQMIERYGSIITDNFSSVTPENEMKFKNIHPYEKEYQFEAADELVNYASDNNMLVRGHTLI